MAPSPAKHRFHVPPSQIDGGRVRFSPEQAHQIASVLRLRPGASVRVFDGAQPADFVARLDRVDGASAEASIVDRAPQPPEPRTVVVARPALLRRDAFEQVLDSVTQLGAAAVAPVIAARCVARDLPDERRLARWRSILREAAEQSGRGVVPDLRPTQTIEQATVSAARDGLALLAYEAEREHTIEDAVSSPGPPRTVTLFVGPEGGFEEGEVRAAREVGARVVSLCQRVLRAEVASPTFLALVLHALGDL